MTVQLKRKQRAKRARRAKQEHLEQLNSICVHGKEMVAATVHTRIRC
jgi:ATP-dependent helicase STH1/SNF2